MLQHRLVSQCFIPATQRRDHRIVFRRGLVLGASKSGFVQISTQGQVVLLVFCYEEKSLRCSSTSTILTKLLSSDPNLLVTRRLFRFFHPYHIKAIEG